MTETARETVTVVLACGACSTNRYRRLASGNPSSCYSRTSPIKVSGCDDSGRVKFCPDLRPDHDLLQRQAAGLSAQNEAEGIAGLNRNDIDCQQLVGNCTRSVVPSNRAVLYVGTAQLWRGAFVRHSNLTTSNRH